MLSIVMISAVNLTNTLIGIGSFYFFTATHRFGLEIVGCFGSSKVEGHQQSLIEA